MTAPLDHQTLRATELWAGLTVEMLSETSRLVAITDEESEPGQTLNGTTAFFRHDEQNIIATATAIHNRTGEPVDILILAGSVGAQAHTLSYLAVDAGMEEYIRIHTLDLSPRFTAIARAGIYPDMMEPACRYESLLLEPAGRGFVRVKDKFREHVNVLPAQSITRLNPDVRGDIVVMTNILGYFSETGQAHAVKIAAERTRHAFAFIGGNVSRLPYFLHKAGLVPEYARAFDPQTLIENFQSGLATIAFKL